MGKNVYTNKPLDKKCKVVRNPHLYECQSLLLFNLWLSKNALEYFRIGTFGKEITDMFTGTLA